MPWLRFVAIAALVGLLVQPIGGSNAADLGPRRPLATKANPNKIRNNSMQGAVAGTPGTMPTNWTLGGVPAGVSSTINSIGSQNGIDTISITLTGTNSSGSSAFMSLALEGTTVIRALPGQMWVPSVFLQTSGSTQINWGTRIAEYNSGGSFLAQSALLSAGQPATMTRLASSYVISNATAAFASMRIDAGSLGNGAAINQTLLIGSPQFEFGSITTAPRRTR